MPEANRHSQSELDRRLRGNSERLRRVHSLAKTRLLQRPRQSEEIDEKGCCASARSSAILATLIEGISKLRGPRWVQKVDNLESGRSHVSEIKLKRTDTTLDLSQTVEVVSKVL